MASRSVKKNKLSAHNQLRHAQGALGRKEIIIYKFIEVRLRLFLGSVGKKDKLYIYIEAQWRHALGALGRKINYYIIYNNF